MTTAFTQSSSLVDFQNAVWEHLSDCGMDTIAFLPDPENPAVMTNIVKSHSRFTIQTAKTLGEPQLSKYDKYDKNNDRAAIKYVLSSLDPTLMSKIKEKTEDTDSFHVIWLQLIKTIQSTSIERFEDLKASIKSRHPSQYAGENIESLAADFRKDARELTTAGQYDDNLTLTMLKIFLLAGGPGNEDYRFPLRSTKQKLDQALLDIGYKEKSGAQAHMVAEKLTYQDVCRQAEDVYRTQYDRKEWPPASRAPDVRAPATTFGNVATPIQGSITRAEVMNLIMSQTQGASEQGKMGNCHKCGKPGHWANKCPENANSSRKIHINSGNRNRGERAHKQKSWRSTPPAAATTTAMSKKVKDKTFNWCEKCKPWTTTHTTATHTGGNKNKNNNSSAAAAPTANLSTIAPDPSVWVLDFDTSPTTTTPLFLLRAFATFLYMSIISTLFYPPITLFIASFFICIISSLSSELAIHLSAAMIPWSTVLDWIVNALREVYTHHPMLLFAPFLWLSLLTFPLWQPRHKQPKKPMPTRLTRQQRRRFAKLLRSHMKPQRYNAGIRANSLHPKYPLRLRNLRHVIPQQAPTIIERNDNVLRADLVARVIALERRVHRYRQRRPPSAPATTSRKGGEKKQEPDHAKWRKAPSPPRAPTYRPVPPVADPNAFYPSPLTSSQVHAAHTIATHFNLACATTLQIALQAPLRLRNALGSKANLSPIIWDSGASISISPDATDFNDTLRPPGAITQLKGIARGLHIKGQGYVTWAVHDANGNLRMITVPAYYVPAIKVRLLSTTSLLQTYKDETITVEAHQLTLSGIEGDPTRGSVVARVNPQNNLPTSDAYNSSDPFKAAEALVATISEVHASNHNLSETEKELLRWHYRLGHIGFKRIQFLMRTGVLAQTEASRRLQTAACKIITPPKCAACQYGKQHLRSIPGKTPSTVVKDREHALKTDKLMPGQCISIDHFICSTRGRLLTSAGKTKTDDMSTGGCIFVDHASGFIHVEHQVSLNSHETLKAKDKFEAICRTFGVTPQEYLADNSKTFTSAEFTQALSKFEQEIKFAGVGAHHHNGIAERNIRTVMAIARTMMLHATIQWPAVADPTLWPLAVMHAVFLVNHMPDTRTGLSPADVFTKTRWEQRKMHDLHVWGCPVYVLDKMITDGRKLPRWTPRSTRTINVGFSVKHASSVPLVLNPQTGYITAQFLIVFDDWFATVSTSASELPNFNSEAWKRMFKDSTYQYILDDEDEERLIVETEDFERSQDALVQQQRVATAINEAQPPQALLVAPPPAVTTPPSTTAPVASPVATRQESPLLTPREPTPSPTQPPTAYQPTEAPAPVQLFRNTPEPPPRQEPVVVQVPRELETTIVPERTTPTVNLPPRRSTRIRAAPKRLGYDGQQGRGYLADVGNFPALEWLMHEATEIPHFGDHDITPSAFKANASDPDTLSFAEAMADVENIDLWMRAADAEIKSLEKNGTWSEVPIAEAKTRILPGTWVFKRKRTPDGTISKYKARYCVRGDLQDASDQETFAPVVAWSTVRLFVVLSITLQWETCTIDFSNAFVQAKLTEPVWIHLPRGFRSEKGASTCLRLAKSLYGLTVAPRLWYKHLFQALTEEGFACANDACLLYRDTIMVVLYVDDLGIAYSNKGDVDTLFDRLENKGLTFTREGSFTDFLGIKFTKNPVAGTLTLTQKGLIQKIRDATGMSESNYNWTPASQVALGIDPDGPPMQETWSYRSVVGMLLYLSTNTRPDIAFAVSQVARFGHNPKKSHASAIKTIVRYLHRTCGMGMAVKPTGNLAMDCYVDADFAGLHGRDPDRSPSSAKSRTGYIITLGGCPILWKSHLQTEISLSTLEAEYSALSSALRTLLPLRSMLLEIVAGVKLPHTFEATIKCQVFEDNNGALLLATNQRITNRTKYFQVKWHFFWSYVRDGTIAIVKVDTQEQWADYLTKGLNRETFEQVRKLVQGW